MAGNIWLIGMMGSGKSSVGRALADRLERKFVDTDDIVTGRLGCSIAEFWGDQGEQAFRDMEAAAVAQLGGSSDKVISTGGGAVLRQANVSVMVGSGFVVWLQASPETLSRRVGASTRRPLLQEGDRLGTLREVLEQRRDVYEGAANATVSTEGLALDIVVERIEELWNES